MASTVNLKAAGLYTSPSELDRPEGSLSEASNIIIKRDGIVEQRRGFKLFGDALPSSVDRVKQLTTYRNRIIRHYSNKLQYDSTESGRFLEFAGDYSETQAGLRIKFIESNGNFYFTTSEGIKKISAKTASQFTTEDGYIKPAGAIGALDPEGEIIYVPNLQTGILPQDSVVAYRLVWNYKDANNNLITGSPSQREVVSNPQTPLMVRDYMRILDVLDNFDNTPLTTARINDKDYINTLKVPLNTTPSQLRSNLITLASKLDNDIFLADQAVLAPLQLSGLSITTGTATITFSSGNPEDYIQPGGSIMLAGFNPTTGTINGAQEVTTVTPTTLTFNTDATGPVSLTSATIYSNQFRSITEPVVPTIPANNDSLVAIQDYMDSIIQELQAQPDSIINSTDMVNVDNLDITTSVNVHISFTLPEGIDSSYFFQLYRSATAQAVGGAVLDDLTPSDELQLVYEAYPTADEFESGLVTFVDVTPDEFRGENLYTNASTGNGILDANEQPPFAKDINRYKNSVFYANTRTKQKVALNLLGVSQMIEDYDNGDIPQIVITNGSITNTYNFITGQQEIQEITTVADVADSLNGTYFLLDAASGHKYTILMETTTAVDPMIQDRVTVLVKIQTNDTSTQVASRLRDQLSILVDDFIVSSVGDTVEVIDVNSGYVDPAVDNDTGFSFSVTQTGRGERIQPNITEITAISGNLFNTVGTADYFTLNSAFNKVRLLFWFNTGSVTEPSVNGFSNIEIPITGLETDIEVADLINDAIPTSQFLVEQNTNVLTVTNIQSGEALASTESVVDAGFTVDTIQVGSLEVLLSPLISPARAVDETTRSFIRVVNRNDGEAVYGTYLSGPFDVPGKMFFQARSLETQDPFYISANNYNTGISFNPDITPETQISSIGTGSNPLITTVGLHGMEDGDSVVMAGTNSVPDVDGLYVINYVSPNSFTINSFVAIGGTEGSVIKSTNALFSENEEKSNRVYYSKFQQPEAVPITNYFDVGAEDKAILRIFPMRDSLFVFKEDGLYRISGDSAPFQLELFDNSFIVLAPDSVNIANNVVYAWTTQGIQSLTEGGAYVISRPIDDQILKLQSNNYPSFKTSTWGVGYESDNSYIVWTVKSPLDTTATHAFRYSTLTQTWTIYDKTNTCGVVANLDDKLYLGAGDTNYIEQERKTFGREDYADREYATIIGSNAILNTNIILPSVLDFEVGDVFLQDQTITVFEFNTMLNKLDNDPGVGDSDYLSLLELKKGSNARNTLVALATKMDSDPGINDTTFLSGIDSQSGSIVSNTAATSTIINTGVSHNLITGRQVRIVGSNSSPSIDGNWTVEVISPTSYRIPITVRLPGTSGTWETLDNNFEDLKICYNNMMSKLNTDTGASFSNYRLIDNNTIQESIIKSINRITRTITINLDLDYLVGDVTVFESIPSSFTYVPNTMGDPLGLKHLREATLMFETRTLTSAVLSFKTDLLPELIPVPFDLDGNGIFGHFNFGTGYFGGYSNSAPFRTFIPRQCQYCRYIVARFSHNIAREDYRILGITVTGEIGLSTRGYR